jgi:hypothetical protein
MKNRNQDFRINSLVVAIKKTQSFAVAASKFRHLDRQTMRMDFNILCEATSSYRLDYQRCAL